MIKKNRKDYLEIKNELKIYFDKIFDNYPDIPENLPSLRNIGNMFKVARNFVKKYLLSEYISLHFDEDPSELYSRYWPKTRSEKIDEIHDKLIEEFSYQFNRYYPNEIECISTIGQLSKKYGVGFISIKVWLMDYIKEIFEINIAEKIHTEIFPTLSSQSPSYTDIKCLIESRQGQLLTCETDWNNMKEQPTKRYIDIKCKFGHNWSPIIHGLLYDNRWCPTCNESKGEQLTRTYMEAIFSKISGNPIKFPTVTLYNAFHIDVNRGGRMHFDGYNPNVKIRKKFFRIAFEYDGKQHDTYPNSIHRKFSEFQELQKRDKLKETICNLLKFKTILIRIKEILGFNCSNPQSFQTEIIRQFQKNTGIKISNLPMLEYNILENNLNRKK
jgi:hypothetical protein